MKTMLTLALLLTLTPIAAPQPPQTLWTWTPARNLVMRGGRAIKAFSAPPRQPLVLPGHDSKSRRGGPR